MTDPVNKEEPELGVDWEYDNDGSHIPLTEKAYNWKKQALAFEDMLHNEQRKIKKFVQLVTEISIKHYDQKQYAKIVNLIYQEIFHNVSRETLDKKEK